MAEMEHSVQLDPEKCVLVMGPQMAAEALSLSEGVPAALSYGMLINIGIQKILDLDKGSNNTEKSRKHALMVNAYELEPAFAAHKIVEALRENDVYKEWLVDLFGSLPSLHAMSSARQQQGGKMVEKLRSLQEKGMLLVYTHYDTILDSQMGTAPVLLGDEEAVDKWAAAQTRGLLHVHGVFSKPDSVSYDCVDYRQLVGETPGGQILKNILRGRSVIFAGFDGEFYDPFLPKFARTFLSHEHPPPLLLSAAPKVTNLTEAFLNLKVSQLTQLDKLLVPQAPAPYLGTSRDCVENKLTTTLLYRNKVSCLDAAELVKVTSGVNVHQLTMRHERLYHHLLLYLDRDGLKELWRIIFAMASPSQPGLRVGLLGVVLDDVITVWMDGGMAAQQEQQHVSQGVASHVDGPAGVREQHSLHLGSPHSSQPPSLSTSVAVIGSTWTTPIPATAISRPLPTASVSTSSSRVGHPSPLVSSTSRTALGTVSTRGPTSDAHMSLLRPSASSHRPHNQVRRVKSEYLMYREKQGRQTVVPGRNGLLLHRESAPEFVQTSEGLVAYRSNQSSHRERASILIGQPRPAPPPHTHHQIHPSPLVKGGAHMEVKIECVDTKWPGGATPLSGAPVLPSIPSNSGTGGPPQLRVEGLRLTPESSPAIHGISKGKEFNEEKQKFIMEAQSWSKQVDSDLAKKVKVTTTTSSSALLTPSSSSSGGRGAYPLGGFLGAHPHLAATQPSLTSTFSPEEQEKFLKQHFEQIMQQQLLAATGMPSLPVPVVSPAKSPVGSGANLSRTTPPPALGHTHSRQSSSTSLTAPLQAQPSSGAMASPKKTSPVGLLPPNPSVGSAPLSMFPFLPTSAAAAAPPPGLLCTPSLPQFPMAAMFNPVYQAALQKLVKGGQMPAALPDHTLLQGLVDKVPVVLPNGQITLVPFGSSLQQGTGDSSPTKGAGEEVEEDEEEEGEEEEEKEDVLKSPLATGCKRMRSPGADTRAVFRSVPPKRRRSSSLPDINQLLHISPNKNFREEEKDGEPDKEKESVESSREKKSNGITGVMPTSSLSSPHPRQQAPPTMIPIPQDMKMGDPMLGFPTPPQSSPLRGGGFSLSPVVLPSAQFHYHQAAQHSHQPMTPVTPGQDSGHNTEELRELVEAGELSTTLPPSPEGSSLPPFPAGRGPIQLWQFLLDLLLSPDKQHMIHWTGNGYEFCILLPEDIAKLWGARKNKPRMNYDKLSRGLRYYYNKGIMDKVQGKKLTFKYTCDVHNYIRSRNAQAHGASTPHVPLPGGEYRSGSSTPVLMQPLSDGAPDGDDVGDEGIVGMTGEQGKLYAGATGITREMELAPPPVFQHGMKKSSGEVFSEPEVSRCDYQGLMGVVKGYGVLGVVEQDSRTDSPARLHSGLCSEAV